MIEVYRPLKVKLNFDIWNRMPTKNDYAQQ